MKNFLVLMFETINLLIIFLVGILVFRGAFNDRPKRSFRHKNKKQNP